MLRALAALATVAITIGSTRVALAEEAEASTGGGMQSPAMFATGVVMGSAGAAGLVAGAYLFTQGAGSCDGVSRDSIPSDAQVDGCMSGIGQQVGGVVALITGGALFLGGIPVLAVGVSPKSDEPATAVVTVAPNGAALTVAF